MSQGFLNPATRCRCCSLPVEASYSKTRLVSSSTTNRRDPSRATPITHCLLSPTASLHRRLTCTVVCWPLTLTSASARAVPVMSSVVCKRYKQMARVTILWSFASNFRNCFNTKPVSYQKYCRNYFTTKTVFPIFEISLKVVGIYLTNTTEHNLGTCFTQWQNFELFIMLINRTALHHCLMAPNVIIKVVWSHLTTPSTVFIYSKRLCSPFYFFDIKTHTVKVTRLRRSKTPTHPLCTVCAALCATSFIR